MIFLNERQVAELLPIADVLNALERAFIAQARDEVRMPLRTIAPNADGLLGAMPAAIIPAPAALGAKLVTVFHKNGARGLPTHQALITLFDADTGEPLAMMDGRFITQIRTAATSALATKALARAGASALAIVGTGVQAGAHIEALGQIMQIKELRVWGRTATKAAAVADLARMIGVHARVAATVADACQGADVICTLTASHDPILGVADVGPGTHINAVGFGGLGGREISGELMGRARLFVDLLEGARHESGAVQGAMREGHLPENPELTRLCDVISGAARGRQGDRGITLFHSLGIAIEDMACARLVYDRASAAGIGTKLTL